MAELEFVVSEGPDQGHVHAFPSATFLVGSAPECQLRFPAAQVQPRHAEVTVDAAGEISIRDLTGQKLLWVNGEIFEHGPVLLGAFVRLGRLELVVRQRAIRSGPSGTMAAPTPMRSPPVVTGTGRQVGLDATARRPTPFAKSPSPTGAGAAGPVSDATAISNMLTPGTIIDGRYEVVGKLAAGGMGEVYRTQHVELGKPMAVKVMLPELSNDPEFVARFKREAIAASRIGQQNIVDISDFGRTQNGRFYFVMEYLDGLTLSSLIHRQGAQPLERVLNISAQVARALAAAHAQSIVHRDLKPENVMLLQRPGQADFVKVLDFGVAKVSTGHGQGGHTAVGMVVGTPQYMSPEQAKAIPVDARSDIYSLGLIVYELLTGRPTFEAETPSMLMVKHVTELPPPFEPGPIGTVPEALEQLVFQMLAKEPNDRPQTMESVLTVLDSLWARAKSNDPTLQRVSGGFPKTATPHRPQSGVAMVRVSGKAQGVTTTSSTTGQEEEPLPQIPRSKAPLVLGVIVVLLAVAVGVTFLRPTGTETPTVEKPVAVVTPTPTPTPVPEPTTPVQPEKVDAVEPPPVAPIELTFTSTPPGAELLINGGAAGSTPMTIKRPPGTAVEISIRAKGYVDYTQRVSFEANNAFAIELQPVKKGTGKKRNGELAPSPYEQEQDLKDSPF